MGFMSALRLRKGSLGGSWFSRVPLAGERGTDDERRERKDSDEGRKGCHRGTPAPEAAPHAKQEGNRRHEAERPEQQRSPNAGEERCAGQRARVMQHMGQDAKPGSKRP